MDTPVRNSRIVRTDKCLVVKWACIEDQRREVSLSIHVTRSSFARKTDALAVGRREQTSSNRDRPVVADTYHALDKTIVLIQHGDVWTWPRETWSVG